MNRDLKNIDKLFHENLSAAGEQPPMHIWDGIENALDVADEKNNANKKSRRRRFAFIAFFILAAGAAAFVWDANDPDNDEMAENKSIIAPAVASGSKKIIAAKSKNKTTLTSIEKAPAAAQKNSSIDKVNSTVAVAKNSTQKANRNSQYVTKENAAPSITATAQLSGKQTQSTTNPPALITSGYLHTVVDGKVVIIPMQGVFCGTISGTLEPLINKPQGTITSDQQSLPVISEETKTAAKIADETKTFTQVPTSADPKLEMKTPDLAATKAAPLVRTKKPGRFSLTVFFAPDITTRNLEQNFGTTRDERKEELIRTERNSELDFTTGARVEYKLNKHFSLQSGLSFSTNTIDIAQKTIFARFDNRDGSLKYRFNFSSGYAYFKPKTFAAPQFLGDSAQALSSTSTLHYINIPLAVKYNMPMGRRFNFSVQAGITARFITKQSIDAVYASNGANEKGRTNEIQGLKTTYFNGVVGIGMDYSLSNKLALTVFPSFNFATTSINRDAPVKAYPNTLSLAGGVKYSF